MPHMETHTPPEIYPGMSFAGPIAAIHDGHGTLLIAYEHGGDHPDSFLSFLTGRDGEDLSLSLCARKGNYYEGQPLGPETAWESVWFELGLAPQPLEEFLHSYRRFFLDEICENTESRKPYLYYNTWNNYQERRRYFDGRPYLESMNLERMSWTILPRNALTVTHTKWAGR